MSCHQRNSTTVTFPGGWGSADWHPPVLSLLQIPLKESDEAKYGRLFTSSAHSRPPLPSLFSLIMGETDLSTREQRAVFVFLQAFYFRRVPPCACAGFWCITHQHSPPPPRLLSYPSPSEEGRNTRERRSVFFPSQSLIRSLRLICWSQELFIQLGSDLRSSADVTMNFSTLAQCGPFLTLAQTSPSCWSQGNSILSSFFFNLFDLDFTMSVFKTPLLLLYLSRLWVTET